MREIIIATGNRGKVREFSEMLSDSTIRFSSLFDHYSPVPDIPETGDSFLENALQKARWVYGTKKIWVMADDSGLEVDALDGRPGVRSARFAGETSTAEENNRLLLELLSNCRKPARTARFRCVLALVSSDAGYISTEGTCEGTIAESPSGTNGFGYDPLFIPAGYAETFAELDASVKHTLSHRGIALGKMRKVLNEIAAS